MSILKRLGLVVFVVAMALLPLHLSFETQSSVTHFSVGVNVVHAEGFFSNVMGVFGSVISTAFGKITGTVAEWASGIFWSILLLLAELLLRICGAVLTFAGSLFDICLYFFATDFSTLIRNVLGIEGVIKSVWVIFRDLSNIVIIGFFVFIAISVILNNHHYGTKQLAVRTILIALFVNFSLFFTMATIDVSNFVAYQFYRGIAQTGGNAPGDSTDFSQYGNTGNVSRRIMTSFGIGNLRDSGSVVEKIRGNQGENAANGMIFMSMIGMCILFILAAYVLLYAAWLLIIRGIKLILVMMTSSLAVACFIVPHKFDKYFNEWKDALTSSAIFAPLLLIMLWAVIQIMDAMAQASGGQGINPAGFVDPSTQGYMAGMLRFAIMGLLLMASVKIAEKMSGSGNELFGMNIPGVSKAFGEKARLGTEYGVQQIAGRRAQSRYNNALAQASDLSLTPEQRNAHRKEAEKYASRMQGALSNFQFKNLGKDLSKQFGLAGKGSAFKDMMNKDAVGKGFKGRMDAHDKHHAEDAEKDMKASQGVADAVGNKMAEAVKEKLKAAGADESMHKEELEKKKQEILSSNTQEAKAYQEAKTKYDEAQSRKSVAEEERTKLLKQYEEKRQSGDNQQIQELQRAIAEQDKKRDDAIKDIVQHKSSVEQAEASALTSGSAIVRDADGKVVTNLLEQMKKNQERLVAIEDDKKKMRFTDGNGQVQELKGIREQLKKSVLEEHGVDYESYVDKEKKNDIIKSLSKQLESAKTPAHDDHGSGAPQTHSTPPNPAAGGGDPHHA